MGKGEIIQVSIVEDDKEISSEWQRVLNATAGMSCIGAYGDAESAAAPIFKNPPHVILMDIGLPGKSGIAFTSEIRDKLPHTEILICSVFHDPDNIMEALRAGAGGYILKSASESELVQAIETIYNGGSPIDTLIARKVISFFRPNSKLVDPLTKREEDILGLVAKGFRNKDIAQKLFISPETVRTHVRNIYAKLQANSRIEALQKYYGQR